MSFAPAARQVLFRSSLRYQSTLRAGARRMNSSASHAGSKNKSDMPWIIASSVIFGPAFLYLLSPTARKSTHSNSAHDHAHSSHEAHKNAQTSADVDAQDEESTTSDSEPATEPESNHVVMKDGEGTEADVTESMKAGEANDAPKSSGASEPPQEPSGATDEPSETPDAPKDSSPESQSGKDSSGTFQKEGEDGPTNMDTARKAAAEGKPPKKAAEEGSSQ